MEEENFDEGQEKWGEETESNENSEQTESEVQMPENIDTNADETFSDEEISENTEESLDESEGYFGNSDFVPSSRANSGATINPFLEQSIEPVENLERDLGNIPGRQTAENNQTQVFNAPQYSSSGSYVGNKYEQPTDDTYPEQIRPTSLRSSIDISFPFDNLPKTKMLNPNDALGWRNQEDADYPEEQKYKFSSETKKRRDDL